MSKRWLCYECERDLSTSTISCSLTQDNMPTECYLGLDTQPLWELHNPKEKEDPTMSKEFPLFPELSEAGQLEAQALLDRFKEQMKKVSDELLRDLYTDVAAYIETDSWTNFRNEMMDGFKDYNNRKIQNEFDFKAIRQKIYEEYREDIIQDLNQDLVKEVEDLKKQIEFLQESRRF